MTDLDKYLTKSLSVIFSHQTIFNLRYLQFLLIQNQQNKLQTKYQQPINQLKQSIVNTSAIILGGSLFFHTLLSLKTPWFSKKSLWSVLLDIGWYSLTFIGYFHMIQRPIYKKDNMYKKLQRQFLQKRNVEYLKFLRENDQYYDIGVDFQTKEMNYNHFQLQELMNQIRRAATQKAREYP